MGYIPTQSLENLKKYSYKAVDKSLTSRYILNPFWNWSINLLPTSIAPNTITLTGLGIVFLNFCTLLYCDPLYLAEKDGFSDPPKWIYYTWALGLFLYQNLDGMDGKQARRTGMASPLGEMFDHGCDAINTTLEVVLVSRALNLGRSWWTVASQIVTLANFYLTTWEEYHTGVLYLSYFSGPVEGILIIIAVFLITGYFGPSFWDQRLWTFLHLDNIPLISSLPNFPLNECFLIFAASGVGFNIYNSYYNVRLAHKGETTLRPLLYLLPFVFTVIIQIAWLSHPKFNDSWIIDSSAFVPFLSAWGLQFAHQVGRIILAHVTKGSFPVWDWDWIWSVLGAVDANLPLVGLTPVIQRSSRYTIIFVWMTFGISFISYARFVTLVIRDITDYLGIACFSVKKRDDKGEWHDARSKTT